MTTSTESRLPEQEALAVTRAMMEGRQADVFTMITGSEHPRALALMACGIAASALTHGDIDGARWLAQRQAQVAAEDSKPIF